MTESENTTESTAEGGSDPKVEAQAPAVKPTTVPRTGGGGEDPPRGEMSAATLGRLMGLATVSELKLIEGKIDLITSKLNNMMVRVDRMIALFNAMPTGADLERIDVQIGALKALIRDTLTQRAGKEISSEPPAKKPGANIVSNETVEGDPTTSPK
ncbi:MAG: hypothetical protein RL417_1275 [Pseudomonadota bacterium]|jgi:hypothetical protein